MKSNKKKQILRGVAIGIVSSTVSGIIFYSCGRKRLIQDMVINYENSFDKKLWIDKKTGLIYELSAECIGD